MLNALKPYLLPPLGILLVLAGWHVYCVEFKVATAVLPIAGLIFVSLQPFWTPIINWKVLSLNNFMEVIVNNRLTTRGLTNSLVLGVATATICMLIAGVVMLQVGSSAETLAGRPR